MAVNYVKFYRGSQVAFDKITTKNPDELYFITNSNSNRGSLYLGDKLIAGDINGLSDLADILLTEVKNGQLLVYNSSNEKWENKTVQEAIGLMTGPTSSQQGSAGLVPAPGIGQQNLFLRGDGTWASPETSVGVSESLVYEVECEDFSYETHITALNAAAINDNLVKGSIGIVKVLIAIDKYQYTAYVYNGTSWAAMDGNYSANSVYFEDDLVVTNPIGTITQEMINEGSGSAILESKDKNMANVLASLLAEEKEPTVDLPSISLTVSSNGSGEVGNTFILPTATFTVTDVGSYSYGSKDVNDVKYDPNETGVIFKQNDIILMHNGTVVKNTSNYSSGDSFSITATGNNLYGDAVVKFTFTANATYTNASDRIPVTNLGNKRESLKIASAAINSLTKTVSYTGYRKAFGGSNTVSVELTSENIRALSNSIKSNLNTMSINILEGATQVIIAVPEGRVVTQVKDEGAFGTDIFSEFVLTTEIPVEGANGYASKNYNVYVYSPSTALGANTYTVTLANEE